PRSARSKPASPSRNPPRSHMAARSNTDREIPPWGRIAFDPPKAGARAPAFLSHLYEKQLRVHDAFGDFVHGAGHADREIVADLDADLAAGHVDGEAAI